MRSLFSGVVLAALFACSASAAYGQEKPKPDVQKDEPKKIFAPAKVQVVLTEYDGEKKVVSLPYLFIVNLEKEPGFGSPGYGNFLRVGTRVPVATEKDGKTGTAQFQYLDVGSNLDCGINTDEEGHYKMRLSFERSSMASPARSEEKNTPVIGEAAQPVFPTFRSQSVFTLRDGQATEVMAATDPLNGHIYRLTVTVTAQK
jgi:hypothetical protein